MNLPDSPDDTHTAWEEWKTTQDPEKLRVVVDKLQPVIRQNLNLIGASGDKHMELKARTVAATAVRNYDPEQGASLKTWTSQQMMQMRRAKRQADSMVAIPERIQMAAYTINKAEREFEDKNDRAPDLHELADAVQMSPERIAQVRKATSAATTEGAFGEGGGIAIPANHMPEALDIAYDEGDYVDRKLLEWRTGYGGATPKSSEEIAAKLKMTPVQLSRASARLSYKLQKLEQELAEI